ncbi:MAG: hypothetical protein L6406_16945 [Desulfobacterales bacterium]|nr:hypothetical protein [Desulfobacterales bacterium]
MSFTRRVIKAGFSLYDRLYRLLFRLQAVGPLLYVGCERYRGPARVFTDQTKLRPGDPVGTLHVNNALIASLYETDRAGQRVAPAFSRLLLASLEALAAEAQVDSWLREIPVYRGINWFRPRGKRIGFQVEALAGGPRAGLLRLHFRLLLYAFAGGDDSWKTRPIKPHVFWLTRQQLMKNFGKDNSEDDSPEIYRRRRYGVPRTG